nr:helix-turn-helix transcriptional regulator [Parabacteroides goldsteinii]
MINFEKLLKEKGKSKADLARFLDIDPANVNRTIKNDNIPLSKIENICSFLGISVIDAFRLSGYDDTPGVTPKATEKEKISDYKDLLLSLSDQLIELYNNKILAPYSVVEEKEEEIRKLNREIGRLESDNERLSKETDSRNQKIASSQRAPGVLYHQNDLVDNLLKVAEDNTQSVHVYKCTEGKEDNTNTFYNPEDFAGRLIPPTEEKNRG